MPTAIHATPGLREPQIASTRRPSIRGAVRMSGIHHTVHHMGRKYLPTKLEVPPAETSRRLPAAGSPGVGRVADLTRVSGLRLRVGPQLNSTHIALVRGFGGA